MSYHLKLELQTESGRRPDVVLIDRAGGRLAIFQASFNITGTGQLTAYLAVEGHGPGLALTEGLSRVRDTLEALGEPVTLRSGTVYTEAEFDRYRPEES